jgi:hypothetical protein
MKKSILAFVTIALTAITFISCGGSKPPPVSEVAKNGEVEVTTPRMELTELAQNEYKDHFWGIGDAPSTREQVAAQQAELNARAALATSMSTQMQDRAKQSTLNSAEGNAVEVFMQRINQSTNEMISGSQIRKTRTMYNKADNQYHVYVLVSVPRNAAYNSLKSKLSGEQALTDAIVSKAIMDFIDTELDK